LKEEERHGKKVERKGARKTVNNNNIKEIINMVDERGRGRRFITSTFD